MSITIKKRVSFYRCKHFLSAVNKILRLYEKTMARENSIKTGKGYNRIS